MERQITLAEEHQETLKYINENEARATVFGFICENSSIEQPYVSWNSITNSLKYTRRAIHVQLGHLKNKDIIEKEWKTVLTGRDNHPVYYTAFRIKREYDWLRELYTKPSV